MTKKQPTKTARATTAQAPEERIIDFAELRTKVPYTRQHIGRLERAGEFPQRIKIGPARVGWMLSEIVAWMKSKAEARQSVAR